MKSIFFISVSLITLLTMSRISYSLYSGLDFLLFIFPFAALVMYIYAVFYSKELVGKLGAFALCLNIILYSGYGILFPLGGWVYSVIHSIFIIAVFLPAVFVAYHCHRNILGLKM